MFSAIRGVELRTQPGVTIISAPEFDGRSAATDPSHCHLTLVASPEQWAETPPADTADPLDEVLLDFDDLDAESCPPDLRYCLGDREAWVYDHGDVADLLFVRLPADGDL